MSAAEETEQTLIQDLENNQENIPKSESEDEMMSVFEIQTPDVDLQSRYWFYCREWNLGRLMVDEVYQTVIEECSNSLNPSPTDPFFARTTDENGTYYWKVEEVEDGWARCRCWDESGEEDTIRMSDLNPCYLSEDDREIAEERNLTIDMYKFYIDNILRPWDRFEENQKSGAFEPLLRRRLNFYSLLNSSFLPRHIQYRYARLLRECDREDVKLAHIDGVLQQVQAQLRIQKNQSEDEKPNAEEQQFYESVYNEYLYSYSVWKVLADRRQSLEDAIWLEHQITENGRTQIVRRKNGPRDQIEKKVVHHLVAANLTVSQINSAVLGEDAIVKTYGEDQLADALANCYEDDEVVLFPGVYDLNEYLFHESVTIRGAGESADQVIILAEDDECNFIFADAENIRFKNLTFEARRNTEGCIVINGGNAEIENCVLNCDELTRGVIIRPFANCQIKNTIIRGNHESSVVVEPAGVILDAGNNNFSVKPLLNQLPPPEWKKAAPKSLQKIEDLKTPKSQIGTKIVSPRTDPAEGAGDTFAI